MKQRERTVRGAVVVTREAGRLRWRRRSRTSSQNVVRDLGKMGVSFEQSNAVPVDHSPRPEDARQRALEDRRLLDRYRVHGDLAARDALIERFLPLARQLARRYQRGNEPLDDLVQVASIGLVKAVDRYDPERGTAFSSYAVPTILGELKRYFRDAGWAVHVPRGMQERVMSVNQAIAKLSRETGHSPTAQEVAAEIESTPEEVLEAMEAS